MVLRVVEPLPRRDPSRAVFPASSDAPERRVRGSARDKLSHMTYRLGQLVPIWDKLSHLDDNYYPLRLMDIWHEKTGPVDELRKRARS